MPLVLCAGPDVQVRVFIRKVLKADGLTVLAAGSAEGALEILRNHTSPIDLVLADMAMPGMNGIELCKNIEADRPGTKAVVMPRDFLEREQVVISRLPFLQKPFAASDLLDLVGTLLRPKPTSG